MWVCLPQDIYHQINRENVVTPVVPPLVPPFNEHGTPAYNAQVQVTWQKNKELHDQHKNMHKVLIEIAKAKLDANYRRALTQMFTGLPDCTFGDLFNRMFTKWGQPTPHDITVNDERVKAPWDPQERDIGDVIKQINDGLFGYFVGHKKNDNDLVTIGEKIILDTGLFATQYGQWRQLPPNECTWAKFDEFWTRQIDLWHETTRTALQHGYGGNVSRSQGSDITDAEQAYYESLQRFGKANQDNAATFQHLSQSNSSMANNIALDVKTLQQQMAQLLLAVNNHTTTSPPALQPPITNAAYGMNPHPRYPAQAPPLQPPPYQAYQQYQQPTHGYIQQAGRRGGRAGGNGRVQEHGRGRGRYNQYVPQQPHGYGQQFPTGRGPNHGFYQQTPMNPVKYHKNWNYYWSCDFDIPDWHTSATCLDPYEGHISTATRENPCNGCMKAKHKTQL